MRIFYDNEIAEITTMFANGLSASAIAKSFNTSVKSIKGIILVDELQSEIDSLKTENKTLQAENKTLLEQISVFKNSHETVTKEPVPCEKKQVISSPPQKTLEEAMAEKPNDPFFKLMIESKRKAAQKEARRVAAELREESEEHQAKMLRAKQLRT